METRSKSVFFVCPVDGYNIKRESRDGSATMYAARRRRKYARSPAQKEYYAKCSFARLLMQPFKAVHQIVFKSGKGNMSARNLAFHNAIDAISGSYPNYIADYAKMPVSNGALPNAVNATATAGTGSLIHFLWSRNSSELPARHADSALLVAYCPSKTQVIFKTCTSIGDTCTASLDATPFAGRSVHTWLSFLSADGSDAAVGTYTGETMVKGRRK